LWVWIDTQQLQNALLNLVLNARDATTAQGRIRVQAMARPLNAAEAAVLQVEAGRYVHIEVADDGSGMDAATQARVFEPFFTTKPNGQGTGLGLAMVYGFVKQSGGAIDIRSLPGAGTTVSLWLPALDAACATPAQAEDRQDPARGDQGLALLVDDDPAVRQVVRRQLLDLGFVVIEAENGSEAMQILEQTPGIALLLTDVVMPGGVDGRSVAAFARDRCRVPRVLLMSGFAPEAAPETAPNAATGTGPTLLAKPFTRSQLAALLAVSPP
jgi:CheY-like chemotaxis protein/anti-sigma regulatory factor (Ser/Thr protein kinase)